MNVKFNLLLTKLKLSIMENLNEIKTAGADESVIKVKKSTVIKAGIGGVGILTMLGIGIKKLSEYYYNKGFNNGYWRGRGGYYND